jgi:hypothetical protein
MAKGSSVFAASMQNVEVAGEYRRIMALLRKGTVTA